MGELSEIFKTAQGAEGAAQTAPKQTVPATQTAQTGKDTAQTPRRTASDIFTSMFGKASATPTATGPKQGIASLATPTSPLFGGKLADQLSNLKNVALTTARQYAKLGAGGFDAMKSAKNGARDMASEMQGAFGGTGTAQGAAPTQGATTAAQTAQTQTPAPQAAPTTAPTPVATRTERGLFGGEANVYDRKDGTVVQLPEGIDMNNAEAVAKAQADMDSMIDAMNAAYEEEA